VRALHWRPRSILEVGEQPDYRFTLANERTFLAWLRTGLGLVAGAVALASLVPELGPRGLRVALVLLLLALSLAVTVGGYLRWARTEVALREKRALPMGALPRVLVGGLALVVAGVGLLMVLPPT
jgi:putative membrane protein